MDLEGPHDAGHQAGHLPGQLQGTGDLAVGEDEVVGAGARRLDHRKEARQPPDQHPGGAPHDREGVGVALLRHQDAGAGVRAGEIDEVELLAVPDLEVLRQLAQRRSEAGRGGEDVDQAVGLPHRVPGVVDQAVEAQQRRRAVPVEAEAAAVDAARPAGTAVDPVAGGQQALGVTEGRVGEGEDVVAEGGGLRLLEVGLVGHDRLGVGGSQHGRRLGEGCRIDDEAGDEAPEVQTQRHPPGLPARAPGMEPAGVVAEPLHEIGLPAVVGVAVRRVVREVLGGDRPHDVEDGTDDPGRRPGRDHPALGEHQQVREVGHVEAVVQERGVRNLQGEAALDQLGGRGLRRGTDVTPAHGHPRRQPHEGGSEKKCC